MDEVSSNIMGEFHHLVPNFDWSQVSAYKYYDKKSVSICNVGSDNEDKDQRETPVDVAP